MKLFLILAVINGFIAVAFGAFGAHGLQGSIPESSIATWQTAVDYQMFHTAALLAVALLFSRFTARGKSLKWSGWLFFSGIVLFSGSLFVYSLTDITSFAMITPIGGVLFLAGWVTLGVSVLRNL